MTAELHLPDLPEVPVAVGAAPGRHAARRGRSGWAQWLRELSGASLPLLLMALLALGTWWLVRHAPKPPRAAAAAAPVHEPDYRLENFQAERFDASGQRVLTFGGQRLRHYPDTDEFSIDALQLAADTPEGRHLRATAREARIGRRGERVELAGQASIISEAPGQVPVRIRSEHLLVQTRSHDVRADKPVWVTQGANEFSAEALEFDGASRVLTLRGPARAVFQPQH